MHEMEKCDLVKISWYTCGKHSICFLFLSRYEVLQRCTMKSRCFKHVRDPPVFTFYKLLSSFFTEISSITWKKYRGPHEISIHPFSHASKDVIKISVKFKGTNFKNLELWRHFCWISLRHCKMPVYKSWRIN